MSARLLAAWTTYDDECERRSHGVRMAPSRAVAVAFEDECSQLGASLGCTALEVRERLVAARRAGLNRRQAIAECERSTTTGEAAA